MNKPTDSVRVVIFDKLDTSRFLILAETDDPYNWKLPGGKFDTEHETPEEAVSRELMEELLTNAEMVGLKKVGELANTDGFSARYIYAGLAKGSEVNPSTEIATTKWVTDNTVPEGLNKDHILSAIKLARTSLNY